MKKYAFFMLFISFFINSCNENSTDPGSSSLGSIKGKVLDDAGVPIFDVLISTIPATSIVKSDLNGEFTIRDLDEGYYIVVAQKSSYYKSETNLRIKTGKENSSFIILNRIKENNNAPNIPIFELPISGKEVYNKEISVQWICNDKDNDPLFYDLFIGTTNQPNIQLASRITQTEFVIDSIQDSSDFYLKVVAYDFYGASSSSQVIKFRTLANTVGDNINPNSLVGFYDFNGNFTDKSLLGNNASSNGVTFVKDRKDINNSAIYFSGNGAMVTIPFKNDFNSVKYSISCWIKPDVGFGTSPVSDMFYLVSRWNMSGSSNCSWLLALMVSGKFNVAVSTGGPNFANYESTSTVEANKWQHIAYIQNSSIAKLFLNGVEILNRSGNIPTTVTNYPIVLGRHPALTCYYKGAMDDLKIYSRDLSEDEIKSLAKL